MRVNRLEKAGTGKTFFRQLRPRPRQASEDFHPTCRDSEYHAKLPEVDFFVIRPTF